MDKNKSLSVDSFPAGKTCVGDIRLCSLDMGFDPREIGQHIQLPENIDGKTTGFESRDRHTQYLATGERAAVLTLLRQHGYDVE